MTDTYLDLVNSGFTKTVAKKLGLPRPSPLRRYTPGEPLVSGPLLVLNDAASEADAGALASQLLEWDVDVHRHGGADERFAAVVVVLTEVRAPAELGEPMLRVAGVLRRLAPGGRVVTVSRSPEGDVTPAVAAARQGIDGMLRSLAKELRGGSTGNGIVLTGEAGVGEPSV
ncbi:MAG TPA: 3-oxoacyl-ACP reductase, partial [Actinotalea sp.]